MLLFLDRSCQCGKFYFSVHKKVSYQPIDCVKYCEFIKNKSHYVIIFETVKQCGKYTLQPTNIEFYSLPYDIWCVFHNKVDYLLTNYFRRGIIYIYIYMI